MKNASRAAVDGNITALFLTGRPRVMNIASLNRDATICNIHAFWLAALDMQPFAFVRLIYEDKCKKYEVYKTVIYDVAAHLKPQKFTVSSDV